MLHPSPCNAHFGRIGVRSKRFRLSFGLVASEDKRARELSKPGVVQRDHGSNVTYSFLVSDDAESEHADAADADDT